MNRNKIDKTWNEFSELKNIELKCKERNLGNTTQSLYLINYTNEVATYSFIGILSTSSEGENTDKTSIIIEFNNRLDLNNFKLETTSNQKSVSSIDNTTEFEKSILNGLQKFGGNSIVLRDNFIRIDVGHIFSTIGEFNQIAELISKIKTTSNNVS